MIKGKIFNLEECPSFHEYKKIYSEYDKAQALVANLKKKLDNLIKDHLQKEVNDMAQIKRGDVVTFSQRGTYAYSVNGVFDTMKVESVNGYEPKCLIVSYQYLYLYKDEIITTTGCYTSVNNRSLPTGETCVVPDYDITITGHIDESEMPSINVK